MMNDKRLIGGVAAVAIVAALGGFGIARWTEDEPAATEAANGAATAPVEEDKVPDTVTMTAQAVQQAGIATETINPGGLGAEIVAQATVSATEHGHCPSRTLLSIRMSHSSWHVIAASVRGACTTVSAFLT